MNFNLTEEQNMVKDSVARFVQDKYDFETRRQISASNEGFSRENWASFAELGWLSIPFSEEHGGFGGSAVDTMVIMEEFGKGLVVEPFVATVLLFGGLIDKCGNTTLQEQSIANIIEGNLLGAFAYLERQSRYDLNDVKTTASKNANKQYTINGEKTVVFNGTTADQIIISTRTSGKQTDKQGISLFLVDANTKGIEKTSFRMMDGQLVANIKFNDVTVDAERLLGHLDEGFALIESVVNSVMVALCSEAQGIMQKLNEITVEYTKTREQFDVPIGSFQALQHRMVEMFMACEQSKSMLYRTVCLIDENSPDAEKNIIALKVLTGRSGKLIGEEAIQLHGGMGLTDELNVGHYVKRLMMINTYFGDADYHQQKFSALTNID